MDEDGLMQRVAAGDVHAFEPLVKRHQRRLVGFATRMLGDADAAQDAAQEAFLRLWRIRARWRPGGSVEGFLLRAVRNVCLDYARAARPTEPWDGEAGTEGEPGPEAQCETRATAAAIREAVKALPEPQRAVFVLSQYEGLSYAEIAAVLDCPIGTVASRKHLAAQAVRRRLRPWEEEEKSDDQER